MLKQVGFSNAFKTSKVFSPVIMFVLLFVRDASALDNVLNYVFVMSRGSDEIAVIDVTTDTVTHRVKLPFPPEQIVLSEEQRKLVASHSVGKTLTIVSLDTLTVQKSIELDFEPLHMRLGAQGGILAVGNSQVDSLALVSLKNDALLHQLVNVPAPEYFTFGRDGQTLFTASHDSGQISVISVAGGVVTNRIPLTPSGDEDASPGVVGLARTPGGELGFVLREGGSKMDVVDLAQERIVKSINVGESVTRAYPTANSQYVIIPSGSDGAITVLSTWTLQPSGSIAGAEGIRSVSTALFDSVAFAISPKDNRAIVFDIDEQKYLQDIPLPGAPVDSVVTADGLKVYVALSGSRQVAVIDALRLSIVKLIDGVGGQPVDVAMVRDLSYCH